MSFLNKVMVAAAINLSASVKVAAFFLRKCENCGNEFRATKNQFICDQCLNIARTDTNIETG
jgi:hypothetical protein